MGKHTITEKKAKATCVDMKGHLMGRICGIVAKKLQNGEKVTLVRCEETNISGTHIRNKLKMLDFLRKRTLTNPGKGPFHHRAPSAMITRVIRGMITKNERNHQKRGRAALKRLVCFEGVPKNMERVKRVVCPQALRVLRLAPNRKYCRLGRLSHELGWKHQADVAKLEEERKVRGAKYFESKKATDKMWAEAKSEASKELPKQAKLLAQYGY
eukprot:TRINITY_DN4650_c2_g1_i1.p2 TRINITY_DN4650_c2_g1~~TRINITY_DN4650_c2_g1_i1.p2  ORF type:complete len:213 (+),score=73.40 TRINITY_DN4650_c2_g1_i1:68-706(+)